MRVQSNSGATAFNKGDLVDDDLLVECKTCVKSQRQFTLKKEWFLKMKQEQIAMRKAMSALVFDFGDGNNYVAVDIQTFKALLRAFKEME